MKTNATNKAGLLMAQLAVCALSFSAMAQEAPQQAQQQDRPSAGAMAAAAAAATLNSLMPGEHSGLPMPREQSASTEVMIGLGTVAGYIKADDSILKLSRSVRIYDGMRRLVHPSQLPLILQNAQVPASISIDPYDNVQAIWLKR